LLGEQVGFGTLGDRGLVTVPHLHESDERLAEPGRSTYQDQKHAAKEAVEHG
jgi:hypothetical protein